MTKSVAMVTGGSRGIGLGIAQSLASDEFDLVICGRREESAVESTLMTLRKAGAEVLYCQCDVGSTESRAAMLERTRAHFGRMHVLVNNAGIAPNRRDDILDAREEEFERVLNVNLQGPYFLTQQVARWMIEQQREKEDYHGCIVNISSISAAIASVNRGEYCISKAGLSMATQLWAVRLAEYGIPVFEVRPGVIETDMTAGVKAKYDALIAEGLVPQNRWGRPEDNGRVVAALARGDFGYSTGQVIMVDGGLSIPRL